MNYAFSVNKLRFVDNEGLTGAGYDRITDSNHVMYGADFLENLDEDGALDEYGAYYYLAEIKKCGGGYYFAIIRELEEWQFANIR